MVDKYWAVVEFPEDMELVGVYDTLAEAQEANASHILRVRDSVADMIWNWGSGRREYLGNDDVAVKDLLSKVTAGIKQGGLAYAASIPKYGDWIREPGWGEGKPFDWRENEEDH